MASEFYYQKTPGKERLGQVILTFSCPQQALAIPFVLRYGPHTQPRRLLLCVEVDMEGQVETSLGTVGRVGAHSSSHFGAQNEYSVRAEAEATWFK